MLVPLSWLKEYVDVSDIPVKELRQKMSEAGLSVERQSVVGEKIENIVIGKITSQERHNDSDHLWVCQVDLGQGTQVQIVTGAPNVFAGAVVPVIQAGQQLPDGTAIEATKLRGVDSQGMMCSERELGLGESHEGIMILGEDAPVGGSLVEYLGLPDIVFDIEVTSNRGDSLSMIGIAREVGALFNRPLKMPEGKSIQSSSDSEVVSAIIDDNSKCLRFTAGYFTNFSLGNSPAWMQQRLLRAGMRPINNLVDISNYVMLELGQPTHAYDATQVKDHHFVVRTARDGETMQTLDKKTFSLQREMLVIADSEKALGIAGIMGGESSKITSETKELLLEAACFDPISIRKTGMKLNIRTDAIMRFERGVDPELIPDALERLNYLLSQYTGAQLVGTVVDQYPSQVVQKHVTLSSQKLAMYMGERLPMSTVERILNSLGFKTVDTKVHLTSAIPSVSVEVVKQVTHEELVQQKRLLEGHNTGEIAPLAAEQDQEWLLTFVVPTWRDRDVSIEEDLIEEVARVYGYHNLKISTPVGQIPFIETPKKLQVKKRVLEAFKGLGYQEVLTYSFNSKDQIEQSGYRVEQALEMASPLTEEHRYLRLSLLPNLLWTVQKNISLRRDLKLFELSSVYHQLLYPMLHVERVSLELEPLYVSGVICPERYSFSNAYVETRTTFDVVLNQLHIRNVQFSQDIDSVMKLPVSTMFHPGRVGALEIQGAIVGLFGEIHPQLQESLGLRTPCFMFELRFDPLAENGLLVPAFEPYSVFPQTTESLSFVLDHSVGVGEIVQNIKQLDERVISVSVRSVYTGDQIESGKKAVTFDVVLQSKEGVIKEKEAEMLRHMIAEVMIKKFNSNLRKN